jgi:hypothetical protein
MCPSIAICIVTSGTAVCNTPSKTSVSLEYSMVHKILVPQRVYRTGVVTSDTARITTTLLYHKKWHALLQGCLCDSLARILNLVVLSSNSVPFF